MQQTSKYGIIVYAYARLWRQYIFFEMSWL